MTFERFQQRFFQFSLMALLFSSGFFWTSAEESVTEQSLSTDKDYACAQALIQGSAAVLEEYFTFLDEYFKVNTPSSEQIADAMLFYRYVEDALHNLYADNAQIRSNGSLAFANQELAICRAKRDEYLMLARTALYAQAMGSATYKTTFQFVDGLKIMNEDMIEMFNLFQTTFPGLFKQMDSGLKCYASQCISR